MMQKTIRRLATSLALAGAVCAAAPASATLMDISFVVDDSGSLGSVGWHQETNFVSNLISTGLPADDAISIVEFATAVSLRYSFAQDQTRSKIVATVNAMPYTAGSTYTKSAVQTAINEFVQHGNSGVDRLMFLVTDGVPNPPAAQSPCSLRSTLDSLGIKVVIIGSGAQYDPTPLTCLVDDVSTDLVRIEDFTQSTLDGILASFNSDDAGNRVPEPASGALAALGLLGLAASRKARIFRR